MKTKETKTTLKKKGSDNLVNDCNRLVIILKQLCNWHGTI